MVRIEVETTINRPIEEVFAYASDIARQPEWVSTLTESQQTDSGPVRVGTKYRQVARFLGRNIELNNEITAYEPPRVYAFSGKNGPMHMEMRFTLTSEGPETTRVTQVAEGEASGFLKMPDAILKPTMKKQFVADLQTLKTNLESGIATRAVTT